MIIWKGAVCCVWQATLLKETRAKRITYSLTVDMAFLSKTWEGAVHCGRQSILLGHFLLALLAFWYYINRQQDFWCTTFHAWKEQCLEIKNLWILWMKCGLIKGLRKVSLQFACVDRLKKEYTKFFLEIFAEGKWHGTWILFLAVSSLMALKSPPGLLIRAFFMPLHKSPKYSPIFLKLHLSSDLFLAHEKC